MPRRLVLTGSLAGSASRTRRLTAASIVTLLVGALTVGVGAAASAAEYPPNGMSHADPRAYKLVSDIARAAPGFNPNEQAAVWDGSRYLTQQQWKEATNKAGQAWISSQRATPGVAGTSLYTQRAGTSAVTTVLTPEQVDTAKKSTRWTAFNASPLLKTVNGAATAVSGYAIGASIGGSAMNLFGMDARGTVCTAEGSEFLSVLSGQDCSDFGEAPSNFVPNADASGESFFKLDYCEAGRCISYAGLAEGPWPYNPASGSEAALCFSGSTGINPRPTMWFKNERGGTFSSAIVPSSMTVCDTVAGQPLVGVSRTGTTDIRALKQYEILCVTPTRSDIDGGNPCAYPGAAKGQNVLGDANPYRTLDCEVKGADGTVLVASTEPYREGSDPTPMPNCPAVPDGFVASDMKITQKIDDGRENVLQERKADPGYTDHMARYPECATGLCTLELEHKAKAVSCFELGTECDGWFQDPAKGDKYVCSYGSHILDLASCNVYAQVFNPERRAAGSPYADPKTGAPLGEQTGPTASGEAFKKPVQDPGGMRDCMGATSMANPVSLVMVPVQCALEWAFVPRQAVLLDTAVSVKGSWDNTAPFELASAVDEWSFNPMMTGCNGILVPADSITKGSPEKRVLNACPGEPLHVVTDVSRLLLNVLTAVAAALLICAYMGWTIGFRGPAEA